MVTNVVTNAFTSSRLTDVLAAKESPFWWTILVAIAGAAFAFYKSFREVQTQKEKDRSQQDKQLKQQQAEMRRDQCSRGLEMINQLLESNDGDDEYYSWDAMKMLDYQDDNRISDDSDARIEGYQTKLKNAPPVTSSVIQKALAVDTNEQPKAAAEERLELYVRECFDEFYFRMSQLEDAIVAGLVTFDDVKRPIDYYVELMATDTKTHFSYLDCYGYKKTLFYLNRFSSWNKAVQILSNQSAEVAAK